MGTLQDHPSPFKNGGQWRTQGKGPHDDLEVRVAYALVNAETIARFLDGVLLQEFRLTALELGYRVMLKGMRGGKPVVAYFYEEAWRDVVRLAVTSLDTARATWTPDIHPLKKARYAHANPPLPLR